MTEVKQRAAQISLVDASNRRGSFRVWRSPPIMPPTAVLASVLITPFRTSCNWKKENPQP